MPCEMRWKLSADNMFYPFLDSMTAIGQVLLLLQIKFLRRLYLAHASTLFV